MKTYKILPAYFILIAALSSCGNATKNQVENTSDSTHYIQVSVQQFEAEGMKTGDATQQNFESYISCNGYLVAPANGIAQLSAPVSGIIAGIRCTLGQNVKKGQVLATVTSNELLIMQQDFAETAARLKQLKLDYDRIKSLYDEKITAEKDFISIESEYKSMLAKYNTLKLRLQLLNLDVSKIEAGKLYPEFTIYSPISGSVTSLNLVLGQYVDPQKNLIEIVDPNQLQAELAVFENDISKVKTGQTLYFNLSDGGQQTFTATLTSVSRSIDPATKTIQCLAKINPGAGDRLINHAYLEARIVYGKTVSDALPSDAILKSGKETYIFRVVKSDPKNYYLQKEKVETGISGNGYTAITSGANLKNIVLKGVYNLPLQ